MSLSLLMLCSIFVPLVAGVATLLIPQKVKGIKEALAFVATALGLYSAWLLFGKEAAFTLPWLGLGIDFSLRVFHFSSVILLATSFFGFLMAFYCLAFMWGKPRAEQFYAYFLFSLGLVAGAVLADNLILLLFFWEALLLTLFGLISIGREGAFTTAIKAFVIVGAADLCLMFGVGLTIFLGGTATLSQISLSTGGLGAAAFIFLVTGAIAKAGSMPFHSWIPDAALDAPLPFMALFPGALEKLIGIYFLTRVTLDLFKLDPGSWLSILLMTVGALTIILAVMMALVQKDYKRLLSFHAISQMGYMVLGVGTCLPVGIVGGLFHMLNNAIYKSCLFLTAGAVEEQTKTTSLEKLGGLGWRMPVTLGCFLIAAASISGVPPFNGFFSKELIYDAALERGWVFYLAAVAGSFFTAASFLKLGHAAFFGKPKEQRENLTEPSWVMLAPMLILALSCIAFGLFSSFPVTVFFLPLVSGSPMPAPNMLLIAVTALVLLGAALNHFYGARKTGDGLKAVDHIHYAPGLSSVYALAEKKFFDPYEIGLKIVAVFSHLLWWLDRAVDWVYEKLSVSIAFFFAEGLKKAHTGNYSLYMLWAILGAILVMLILFM